MSKRSNMKRKIIVARHAGFCSGVKAAVKTTFESAAQLADGDKLYTYGALIHNEAVGRALAERGVAVIDDLAAARQSTVVIRSHGVAKRVYSEIEKNDNILIDATCVFVKRVHQIVEQRAAEGYQIVIIGDATHPEVQGISGWCSDAIVINCLAEAAAIDSAKPLCVVAQTTLNEQLYDALTDFLAARFSDAVFYKTICSATQLRQDEARDIAGKVDFMIVIGGKNSSNTKKLYDISKKICKKAQLIQNFSQIDMKLLRNYGKIGIVTGASTPDWIIDEVIRKLKIEGEVVINGK